MMRLVSKLGSARVWWPAIAAIALAVGPADTAPIPPGCLPDPLPSTPIVPITADVAVFDERMRVEVWRQPCVAGAGTAILMRAAPASAAPLLCSGDFAIVQGGVEKNALLQASVGGSRLCEPLAAATTVIVDAAAGTAIAFDRDQAFTLAFVGWESGAPKQFDLPVPAAGEVSVALAAAVLPASRSVQVNVPATAFATVIASGSAPAVLCAISASGVPGTFQFWATDAANNAIGEPNPAVTIDVNAPRTFLLAFTPTESFAATMVQFGFDCDNTPNAPVIQGVNTLLLSAATGPVPDIVALAATPTGNGIVNVPATGGTGAFAVATVNVGAGGRIIASADTGSAAIPVALSLCQTNPGTGQCVSDVSSSVAVDVGSGQTPTFSVFVRLNGPVPLDPGRHRVFVRFEDGAGAVRGATSVAISGP